ncbi:MAG: efflux RND transporter periplasmic adaptor subunit [Lentisphaeria bacterium]|nr:efflux RND transporter periplasmic adaptor subunit [Lentisphaeria bacterium]
MGNRKLVFVAALSAVVIGLQAAPPNQPPPVVPVEKVESISESAGKKYVGHLEAIEEVEIRARISGNIDSIKFREGDLVKKGELLFELEDTTYRSKVQAARAQVDQIKAELKYAEDNFNRQRTLRESSAVSQSTMDEAQRLYSLNKAKLQEAEATLLDAENNLSYCRIYAPITGRIGRVTYTQGNYVTPQSEKLADIVQSSPIYVNFAISERDFLSLFGSSDTLKKTGNIRLTLSDGTLYKHPGQVAFIDNKVDLGTNTLTIWATFDNSEGQLIPGGFVTVVLSRKAAKPYPAVKLSAVMTGADGNFIYVVDKENKVVRRKVETGPLVGAMQLLYSGAEPGETVIVGGTNKTAPGRTVEPFWPKEQKK